MAVRCAGRPCPACRPAGAVTSPHHRLRYRTPARDPAAMADERQAGADRPQSVVGGRTQRRDALPAEEIDGDPVLPGAAQQHPALADPRQPLRHRTHSVDLECHDPAHRGHQAAGPRDAGVLGTAAVGQLTLPLGVEGGLGLRLQVVEHREQLVLPGHGRTLPRGLRVDNVLSASLNRC